MVKKSKLLLGLLILPWLTVPFLGVNALKKYLPSAIFICTFTKALDIFGEKKKWWHIYKGIGSLKSVNFFNWGCYFFAALWTLKMTYGKFPLYLIINVINHILFTFFGLKFLKRYKIASVNLKKLPYLTLLALRGLLLYGFQLLIDLKKSDEKS
jgi:hypothetical protein